MNDTPPNFFGRTGYLQPEETRLLRSVYRTVAREPWFTTDKEARRQFARHILVFYQRGLIDPEKLKALCILDARSRYAELDCTCRPLEHRRLLIVEDDWYMANDAARTLIYRGASVIGPAANVADALHLLHRNDERLHGALLDIRLGEERVFPVAEQLQRKGVPFAFIIGHGDKIPRAFDHVPKAHKPLQPGEIAGLAVAMLEGQR
ncbi:MAG: hypothetical protein KDE63_12795 [Novosphingobium sp.]|nr:hypothetical protein [Novosphingobium sp.]